MFTGIVEELGTVTAAEPLADGSRLTVAGPVVTSDAGHGDSIAVNGVCLTVVDVLEGAFTVDVVAETLRRSSLKHVGVGDRVNLERAMALGDRLGGHIVQGHVDGTAVLRSAEADGLTRFDLPARLSRYVVEKGSITVDGVSLTVVEAGEESFSVALIPTTKELTTLGFRAPGDEVNIEVDVLAKHVERLAQAQLADLGRGASPLSGDNGGSRGRTW
ncbi:riboflavin synthase alpha chain [Saccharopolyspora erythraea NRRL 2338]|uniref:Riboflavin synthase n=2 Tax=Saccharopolyspora erythraea TaxID=1836 RepID=A4FBK3_SACEN|nr:riboflavin synthase [Saccharopolyspora erythraea]EQD81561.1 riboflavin synthase subunit alpha [Saccharopolyspora erythraea D]PFG95208.1 riboflavin synthase alpha chain [Saccharopolyspora erythraea NRRL 2338]QRK91867.1 riboflavin synthase [Saccharopolyspora erythraea]CAM01428.1 riboflavin synthase alpha chain [Saccharopolyspora erythraea NRRL 2338]